MISHRNYDWEQNAVDRRPGWNFLMFGTGPKGLGVCVIEHEPRRAPKGPRPPVSKARLLRLELDVDAAAQRFFVRLMALDALGPVRLACGTELHFRRARRTRLTAVVVETPGPRRRLRGPTWVLATTSPTIVSDSG